MAESIKKIIEQIKMLVQENKDEFEAISDYIFKHPELGGEEFESSKYLADKLKERGFKVSFPYEDLPTAFIAEIGPENGVAIGFLAEYDALPGYNTPTGKGHACGHNWIASTMCGCAMVLAPLVKTLNAKIVVFGTPAEETFGGKVIMAKYGAFNNMDVVMQAHLEAVNIINTAALAMNSIEIVFHGKAAHAASYPEEGINALDGVQLTFAGINALRQHLRQDVRIHGIVTEGGIVTNTVPDRGICRITMRAKDRDYLKYVRKRVMDCVNGAALMSGATITSSDFENPYDDIVNIPTLMEVAAEHLKDVGITEFLSQEDAPPPGSSDVGNVSYICPTLYVELALPCGEELQVHNEDALELVNTREAYDKMFDTIIAYAGCSAELCLDKNLLNKVKKEHKKLTTK